MNLSNIVHVTRTFVPRAIVPSTVQRRVREMVETNWKFSARWNPFVYEGIMAHARVEEDPTHFPLRLAIIACNMDLLFINGYSH